MEIAHISTYEVEMRGQFLNWPDDWEAERKIRLLDCIFTR